MPKTHTLIVAAETGTWIRAYAGDILVASSRDAILFRESSYKLSYAFPKADVSSGVIAESGRTEQSGYRGKQVYWNLVLPGEIRDDAAYEFTEVKNDRPDLRGYLIFERDAIDRWMEEEEEIIGHPRDPYTRIDVRQTTRHIRVEIDGIHVLETHRPLALTETGLPVRYYVPFDDVNWDILVESETSTICPYKGVAKYWSVKSGNKIHSDLIWAYPDPLQDAILVKDGVGYYHEKMTVSVDGELQEKPPVFFTK